MSGPSLPVVVVGLGALGSAAAWRLAERGVQVVGLDRYRPPHALGSTHGGGRVIREGFFEAPFYVPLVRRAYEGWRRLEGLVGGGGPDAASPGPPLLRTTGALMVGDPDGTLVRGTLEAVRAHGIRHRVLTAEEIGVGWGVPPETHGRGDGNLGTQNDSAESRGRDRAAEAGARDNSAESRGREDGRAGPRNDSAESRGRHVSAEARGRLHGNPGRGAPSIPPGLRPEPHMVGVLEERAGVLHPERCVRAALREAERLGADLRFGTPLEGWEVRDDGVVVRAGGQEIRGSALVLAAGPWMTAVMGAGGGPRAMRGPSLPLEVVRQVTHRFAAAPGVSGSAVSGPAATGPTVSGPAVPGPTVSGPGASDLGAPGPGREVPPAHPAFRLVTIWEYAPDRFFYTVPEEGDAGDGRPTVLKAAVHYGGAPVDPDTVNREVSPDEVAEARALLDRFLPGAAGEWLDSSVCLYTNTPDHHFVVGPLQGAGSVRGGGNEAGAAPGSGPPVLVLGGGSGHAFKFAPALGELAADLILGEEPFMDLSPFRPGRFPAG